MFSTTTTTTTTDRVDEGIELAELFGDPLPQQANVNATLPTPVLPPTAHTRSPAFNYHPPNIQTTLSSTHNLAVVPDEKKTWFSYVVEYAPVESLALLLDVAVKSAT
jgi:hypothetical protein